MSEKGRSGLIARAFSESLRKAERYVENPQELQRLTSKVQHKMDRQKIPLMKVGESMRGTVGDLSIMSRMAKAYGRRRYRRIPWGALAMIAGALLYFVTPTDAIPDFIMGMGLIDDATVIALVAKSLATVIEEFRLWEKLQVVDASATAQIAAAETPALPADGEGAEFQEIPVGPSPA